MNSDTVFDRLKRFDEMFALEVFKESNDVVTSVKLFIAATVFKTAFKEKVVKGDSVRELGMGFDFNDTAHDIIF